VELTRADITGQTFPRATDGYDRDAVDRHLEAIADAAGKRYEPVGADAGEQMRTIVEGAERSARALQATAQREADQLRESARAEAEAMRDKAARESADQVAAARAAVTGLLERVEGLRLGVEDSQRHVREAAEAMAQRLGADSEPLVATLRERAEALGAELALIGSGLAGDAVKAAARRESPPAPATTPSAPAPAARPPSVAPAPEEAVAPAPGTGLSPADLDEVPPVGDVPGEPSPATQTSGPPVGDAPHPQEPAGRAGGAPPPGTERARLVALNMAVSGTPRAEAERHLREELSIEDPAAILDEVYARAGGQG